MRHFRQIIVLTFIPAVMSLGARAEGAGKTPPAQLAQNDEGFLPLGVYWLGEYTFRDLDEPTRWAETDEVLDSLAQRNVNPSG